MYANRSMTTRSMTRNITAPDNNNKNDLRKKEATLRLFDEQLKQKEATLRNYDARLKRKEATLRNYDERLKQKEATLRLFDEKLRKKESIIKNRKEPLVAGAKSEHIHTPKSYMVMYFSNLPKDSYCKRRQIGHFADVKKAVDGTIDWIFKNEEHGFNPTRLSQLYLDRGEAEHFVYDDSDNISKDQLISHYKTKCNSWEQLHAFLDKDGDEYFNKAFGWGVSLWPCYYL